MQQEEQPPNNLDQARLLRAQGRLNHATVAKRLSRLIQLMGWDKETHEFLHAAKFEAIFRLTPSEYLTLVTIVLGQDAQVSRVAEDHLSAEAFVLLVLATDEALKEWQQNPGQEADQMAVLLRKVAASMLAVIEQADGKTFNITQHIREQFTLAQARAYIKQHKTEYDVLPGQWYIDHYGDEFEYVDTLEKDDFE